MERGLIRYILVAVTLCLGPAYHAVQAQSSGLLLGVRYSRTIDRPLPYYAGDADSLSQAAYYTIFITRRGRILQVARRLDGLAIPTDAGFIRAGTRRSVYNNWVEDFVWSARPGERPTVPGIQPFNGENCEGYRSQSILFAGSNHLSLEQRTAGYCAGAPHPWYFNTLAVVPVDSTTHEGLAIEEVLGVRGRRAFESAAARLEERLDDDVVLDHIDTANWGIIRNRGQWQVIGRVNVADQIAVDAYEDLTLNVDLPRRVVERNDRVVPWSVVRRVAPDVTDYMVSPQRDLIVILRPENLTVHPLQDSTIGRRLLQVTLPDDAQAVLTRWAGGDRVDRWERQLGAMRTLDVSTGRLLE